MKYRKIDCSIYCTTNFSTFIKEPGILWLQNHSEAFEAISTAALKSATNKSVINAIISVVPLTLIP